MASFDFEDDWLMRGFEALHSKVSIVSCEFYIHEDK